MQDVPDYAGGDHLFRSGWLRWWVMARSMFGTWCSL